MADFAEGLPTPKPFSRSFIDLYLTEVPYGVGYDLDEDPIEITLSKRPEYGLRLNISLAVDSVGLELLHPLACEPLEIAYADHAHPIPNVLRVEEVDSFCVGVRLTVGLPDMNRELFPEETTQLPSEAIARILLSPFTVPTPENEVRHRAALEQALTAMGFSNEEIESLRKRVFFPVFDRREHTAWLLKGGRWYVTGEFAHSRRSEGRGFPHRELSDVIGAEGC